MSTAPAFIQQLFDSNGRPLSGGKLSTFVGGSTNLPKELYSDKALTTQLPNPLIADGSGYLPQYFMTSGAYKFECETSDNVLLWTRDWIEASASSTSGASEYKVKVDQFDTAEYLVDKVVSSDGIDVVLYTGTTRKLEIKSKGQSKVNAGDALGYLNQKFADTSSIKWSEVANKMTANVEVSAISATIPGDRKTVVDVEDLDAPGYLADKIVAGTGPVTVTAEESGLHKQLHINVFGQGDVGTGGYVNTMYVANAIHSLAPNMIVRSELVVLFVPINSIQVNLTSKFGAFINQGGSGTLRYTLRDEQYRLIANSIFVTNPSPQVFLELICGNIQNPVTGTPLTNYKLDMGGRYYLGINWDANGLQLLGDDAIQNNNIQPYSAYKVDNLTSIPNQLTGGGENKMRPFIRLLTPEGV